MKKLLVSLLFAAGLGGICPQRSQAQSVEDCIEQLVLDYEKLASLKNMLGQMYTGYEVLSKGYSAVKSVAQGNFSLHEAFLGGLYLVSPTVRKYPRIADIISDQATLVSEYRNASGTFQRSGHFSPDELDYMLKVYNHLVSSSLQNLDDLAMIVTDSQLRMSDAERLTAIDRIYLESRSQLGYLRRFNGQASAMSRQRAATAADQQSVKSMYGIR
ncbi:TerB family tellurite resistance protein [Mucilaginibacter angelicae]|uniref:TerB family tellurite resistance protein n=1 Tax=Mucilaginibacter angelicae TaxID=869718 RepID=A0ABV6L5E1_9SPHI